MTLNLQLSREDEAKLRQRAAEVGQDVQSFVLEAVQNRLEDGECDSTGAERRPRDHRGWLDKLRAWTALHPVASHPIDDSRGSIYGDRGQ